MSDPGRFARGVQLIKVSLRVITQHKKLLLFPVAGASLVFGLFLLALVFAPEILQLLISMFCVTFLNVVFYEEIIQALAWERVSFRHGLAFAGRRIWAILVWSVCAVVGGVLVQALSERLNVVGSVAVQVAEIAWSVAAVFVIPVIIRGESSNPVILLRRSATTIKKIWGESLVGYVGLIGGSLLMLLPLWILILAAVLGDVVSGAIAFICLTVASITLFMTASSILVCVLYVYASEGVVPEPYSLDMLDVAWAVKKA